MTSSFEGQPPQNKAFSNQNKGHLGSRAIAILLVTPQSQPLVEKDPDWLAYSFMDYF